jgi:hypothetical protein
VRLFSFSFMWFRYKQVSFPESKIFQDSVIKILFIYFLLLKLYLEEKIYLCIIKQ